MMIFALDYTTNTLTQGSVCAYLSSVFREASIPCGRFTSPHLVDRWDCITLDGVTVNKDVFLAAEITVKATDAKLGIGATEFEILTATAFEIFSRQKVDVAVVEVGMGGRLDSTNVFASPLVTVVTKIAMDHMGFLGATLEGIAGEKAGIMKKGAPSVVDGSNTESVLSVLRQTAIKVGAREFVVAKPRASRNGGCEIETPEFGILQFPSFLAGSYQPANLSCAINALSLAREWFPAITPAAVHKGIGAAKWPGRMETVDIFSVLGKRKFILMDGAHNPEAAGALAEYVDLRLRTPGKESVAWLLAASKGKDIEAILRNLLKRGDHVFAVAFGPVDGMPWVMPTSPLEIVEAAKAVVSDQGSAVDAGSDIKEALNMACRTAGEGNVVVAGSLWEPLTESECFDITDILGRRYLVGDVTRLTRCA